jgi:branched-subunit amino acid transport protein
MSDEVTTQNGNGRVRWKNRRKMAWMSLISMTLVTYLILFTNWCPPERLKIVTEVITWYYFASAAIIGAYMGATTFAHIKGR